MESVYVWTIFLARLETLEKTEADMNGVQMWKLSKNIILAYKMNKLWPCQTCQKYPVVGDHDNRSKIIKT